MANYGTAAEDRPAAALPPPAARPARSTTAALLLATLSAVAILCVCLHLPGHYARVGYLYLPDMAEHEMLEHLTKEFQTAEEPPPHSSRSILHVNGTNLVAAVGEALLHRGGHASRLAAAKESLDAARKARKEKVSAAALASANAAAAAGASASEKSAAKIPTPVSGKAAKTPQALRALVAAEAAKAKAATRPPRQRKQKEQPLHPGAEAATGPEHQHLLQKEQPSAAEATARATKMPHRFIPTLHKNTTPAWKPPNASFGRHTTLTNLRINGKEIKVPQGGLPIMHAHRIVEESILSSNLHKSGINASRIVFRDGHTKAVIATADEVLGDDETVQLETSEKFLFSDVRSIGRRFTSLAFPAPVDSYKIHIQLLTGSRALVTESSPPPPTTTLVGHHRVKRRSRLSEHGDHCSQRRQHVGGCMEHAIIGLVVH